MVTPDPSLWPTWRAVIGGALGCLLGVGFFVLADRPFLQAPRRRRVDPDVIESTESQPDVLE